MEKTIPPKAIYLGKNYSKFIFKGIPMVFTEVEQGV